MYVNNNINNTYLHTSVPGLDMYIIMYIEGFPPHFQSGEVGMTLAFTIIPIHDDNIDLNYKPVSHFLNPNAYSACHNAVCSSNFV